MQALIRNLLTLALFVAVPARGEEVACTIHASEDGGKISRHLYGHFVEHLGRCIYDGIWVGEDSDIPNTDGVRTDVFEALKAIKIPNLRWPGGCFADDYHWRDGIGPREERPKRLNIHWGQEVETNAFGTHEFLNLCEKLDAEPYLAGNVGSGTPQELRDWVEYITYDGDSELANLRRENGRDKPWRLRYLGVGNENWGCGGDMRPEYYADLFRRYAMFCRDFSGNKLYRIACGPSGFDKNWNQVLMKRAHGQMAGYSLHFYTLAAPWSDKQPATGFDEKAWIGILRDSLQMRRAIHEAEDAMDPVDPDKRIGILVDEWGTWYRSEPGTPGYALYQQNTLRDALVAGLTLHIFHDNNDRVVMANLAQAVNVLQSLILTDGPKMALTPTYHVFDLFQVHHDAKRLPVDVGAADYVYGDQKIPAISVSASTKEKGVIDVSIVNTHAREAMSVTFDLDGATAKEVMGEVLTAEKLDAHNTFDEPDQLKPAAFEGARVVEGGLKVATPPRSVVVLRVTVE